jgi:MSHA biogenesis protein MshI
MLKKWFSKKTQKQISLYLGDKQIVICDLQEGLPVLLAKKAVNSEGQWSEAFTALVNKHQLQGCQVSVVLGREFYQTFVIEKPKVEESELLSSLPFTIKDLVSESVFNLVVDYYDMPFQQRKGEQITVICLPKTRVLMIRDMLLKSALQLDGITIEELALAALLGCHNEANILLSQQNNELVLTVVKEGELYFTHRLRGFNELLVLPLADVENTLLDGLSLELQRALDYINSQLGINAVGALYLAVVCPDIKLLSEKLGVYLARNVQPYGEEDQYDFLSFLAYGGLTQETAQ